MSVNVAPLLSPGDGAGQYWAELHGRLIGCSEVIMALKQDLLRVVESDVDVLVLGETGTGKEVVARAIHSLSQRAEGPFVATNCGVLPEATAGSLLFGHEKGAFTGADRRHVGHIERAHNGSLFLDEIGELSVGLQCHFLRVLDRNGFVRLGGSIEIRPDFRLIAATNRNLEDAVAQGGFREDLFYRLSVAVLHLPPLRERREDIPLLARHFISHSEQARLRGVTEITADALDALQQMTWPGNIRQLRHAVDRLVTFACHSIITSSDVRDRIATDSPRTQVEPCFVPQTLQDLEHTQILKTLRYTQGNQSMAAKLLGVSRSKLIRKLHLLDEPHQGCPDIEKELTDSAAVCGAPSSTHGAIATASSSDAIQCESQEKPPTALSSQIE